MSTVIGIEFKGEEYVSKKGIIEHLKILRDTSPDPNDYDCIDRVIKNLENGKRKN